MALLWLHVWCLRHWMLCTHGRQTERKECAFTLLCCLTLSSLITLLTSWKISHNLIFSFLNNCSNFKKMWGSPSFPVWAECIFQQCMYRKHDHRLVHMLLHPLLRIVLLLYILGTVCPCSSSLSTASGSHIPTSWVMYRVVYTMQYSWLHSFMYMVLQICVLKTQCVGKSLVTLTGEFWEK